MSRTETVRYDDAIVRKFMWASLLYGLVGMLVGLWLAIQLVWPSMNFAPYFTFGRIRPLHTNAVIFAFAGNAFFAAIYYSSQRLLKAWYEHKTSPPEGCGDNSLGSCNRKGLPIVSRRSWP